MASDPPLAAVDPPEYEEITLADIVRVLHRRKLVLGAVFVIAVLIGGAITVLATPTYEASATLIPLEHQDIIRNWLDSRHAAEVVVAAIGTPLKAELFPGRWDGQGWTGPEPSTQDAGRSLDGQVAVATATGRVGNSAERLITITVTLTDPVLARDVANAYVGTLTDLRPDLENITKQAAFDQYYDGSNEQEAQSRAEVAASQKAYWIELDSALTPQSPASPNVVLNLSLAIVLGLVLGVFTVFFAEWLSNYRAESKRFNVPEATRLEEPAGEHASVARGTAPRPGRRYS